ncbi:MAG: NifB/NifX family molybdenum-iron cluster-binding protein [Erysipelotrichaceae bacterium]|nr:NifB/NifX family molybdenum-iron cluster-binding protein [Erysipelotrichaceae bacterium]MDY5252360.1 NifB/NifX family molybdenum-iron cluster-binding protein [Erysipelotrichaceae bacterium]
MKKIAVSYDEGMVFQHFGHTAYFKIYRVNDDHSWNGEVVSTHGQGHSALANFLAGHDVNVLLCGGIGAGAINALTAQNIEVYPGCSGQADEIVDTFLAGKLVKNTGANCQHHDHHECHDDHHCQHDCHHE